MSHIPHNNENGPAETGPEKGKNFPNNQKNYTPEDAARAIQVLQTVLPPEASERVLRAYTSSLASLLAGNGDTSDVTIESMLPPLRLIPANQVIQRDYPDIPNLVGKYLTAGLWFLYGKPKVGKSWLAAQLALAVAAGGKLFDQEVRRGRVLYLALEDGERRLKKRMLLQQWPHNAEVDYMLSKDFREQIGTLEAGYKRLTSFIERQGYLLTVIDTFSRAINLNQIKTELMVDVLAPLQEFAQAKDKTFVLVDHEAKRQEDTATAITALFGGIAKAGVADGLWRLYKERGKGVKIDIEGRDLEDTFSLKLRFDRSLCYWYSEGDAETIEITERRKAILDALANLGKCSLTQLEDATGQAKGNLHTRLQDLVTEGLVIREKQGNNVFYELKNV
ncbi:MAG: hypothetical protein Fur0043_13440 [Anaerolineales bacterium]